MSTTIGGVRIVDMPDLGAVNNASSLVGERAGSGRFSATALRAYVSPSTVYGAVGDGVADDTAAIQAAIDSLAAYGGSIFLPPGVYRISTALKMRPGVTLQGGGGATITQGNGANLSKMIDFDTNAAANAGINGLTIDGNRANNTGSNLTYAVASAQSETSITRSVLANIPGLGLLLSGAYPRVEDTGFFSVFSIAIALQGAAPNTRQYAMVCNNTFANVGYFCIGAVWSDFNLISGNKIVSPAVVNAVNTSGTAVTLASGTNFSTLLGGMFMRIATVEYQIQSVNSATSITLTSSAGTSASAASVAGGADMINIDSCQGTMITGNETLGGMSSGVMLHNLKGTVSALQTTIIANVIAGGGNVGIAAISPGPVTSVDTTLIATNTVVACGKGGAANAAATNVGILVTGANTTNTVLAGNLLRDAPTATQQYGIYVDVAVPTAYTKVTGNAYSGNAVADTFGVGWAPYTVTLTAATGTFTTASASGRFRLNDKTIQFQVNVGITTNGTAAGAIVIGLPRTAASGAYTVTGRGSVSGKLVGGIVLAGATTVSVTNYDASYPGATGETLVVTGTYEAA